MFSCDHCDKTFPSTYHLSRHETVHTNLRAFKCTLCRKTFAHKVHLNRHVRIIHEKRTPFNSLKCDHCDKLFESNTELSRHQLVHNKLRDFKCTLCSKTFAHKFNLHTHVRSVHEKLKPFRCDQCDNVFSLKRDLSRHQTVHNKNSLHGHTKNKKCLSCYQTLKSELARHLCDKCHLELNPIIILKMAQIPEEETEEKVEIPKHHLNHNVMKTFRCLECCFSTEDDFAMLKHHLNNHFITTDIV
jgi:KRAB domain-containing zinc finger protein